MTFRTRTVQKRSRRPARRSETRRTLYFTLAFGGAIIASLAILGGVLFANYYADHMAPLAAVNGHAISKDDVRARAEVNNARYNQQIQEYQLLANQGKISSDEKNTLIGNLQSLQDPSTLYSDALTQLISDTEQGQYAEAHGITVTDAQVNDQIAKDGTVAEMRHIQVIGVQPTPTPPSVVPTDAEVQAAKDKAQGYLDSIKSGGKKWADVSTEANGDAGGTGDKGLFTKTGFQMDPDLLDAAFNLQKANDITDVIKCSDGVFRFAQVTEIVVPYHDPDWQNAISASASFDAYKSAARAEATRTALEASILKQYVQSPTKQRHVLEIAASDPYGTGIQVLARLILYAPNNNPTAASGLANTDPAWAAAKKKADDAVAALKKDPTQFATLAKSADNVDPYFKSENGDTPWLPASIYQGDATQGTGIGLPEVATALFTPANTPNQILDPILTTQGYYVAQFLGERPGADQRIAAAQLLINSGTDFSAEAKLVSSSADAVTGGDMGWVSPYQFSQQLNDAIFSTPVGSMRLVSGNGGFVLIKVVAEESRTPDAAQQRKLNDAVFSNWLGYLRANVWQDPGGTTSIVPPTPAPGQ